MAPSKDEILALARAAKEASRKAAVLDAATRVRILHAMADALDKRRDEVLRANEQDVGMARLAGLHDPMIDRLELNDARVNEMVSGLREVAALPDRIGDIIDTRRRPNGLMVGRMIVPLGCIAIIYEARPNVTADAAGICIKSGNTVILRGGSEAFHSNKAIAGIIGSAAEGAGFPAGGIQFIDTTDRVAVDVLLTAREAVDVLIPRGGAAFIEKVVSNARVPVIETGAGNCHVYVDDHADLNMATDLVFNGKVQRPSVCNATKKVLVHVNVASQFLAIALPRLVDAGVQVLVHENARSFVPDAPVMSDAELREEFLDMRLGIIVVKDMAEAIDHVNEHSSHHTEAIITRDYDRAMCFINAVDSASLFWNASTRFTDGGQFGMGAEIGISTQKLHARGPMGIAQLTTTKFVTFGTGQARG